VGEKIAPLQKRTYISKSLTFQVELCWGIGTSLEDVTNDSKEGAKKDSYRQ
jgi:hypothetical protein